jgi:predicted O-methyltransferase YrrM
VTTVNSLDNLRGHGSKEEYRALAKYAGKVKPDQVIVEIGTFRGKSACFLAHGSRAQGTRVYTIDPHDLPGNRRPTGLVNSGRDYTDPSIPEEAKRAIESSGYGDRVTMIQGFSVDVVDLEWSRNRYFPIGLLFLDGDHRESAVRDDLAAWLVFVAKGGFVVFDDYKENFPDVVKVADELIAGGAVERVALVGSLLVTRKTA